MNRLRCIRVESLLGEPRGRLSSADRLLVERHLSRCEACARTADVLDAVRRVVSAAVPASRAQHERALRGAFVEVEKRRDGGRAPRRGARLGVMMGAAAATILAATVAVLSWSADRDAQPERREIATGAVARTVTLGRAHVRMGPNTRLRWEPGRTTIVLRSGALEVDVAPAAGARFRVATAAFTVEVVGTSFRVDEHGVDVTRGEVVVRDRTDRVLRSLAAGESFRLDEATAPHPSDRPIAPAPPAAFEAAREASNDPPASSAPSVRSLLGRARRALARGDLPAARRAAEAALAAEPTRSESAEARMILAEHAQAGGDEERAIRAYGAIASRYPELPAAETASFAAARLRANVGPPEEARVLLQRYLERYPSGRFRREATARLRALEERP